MFAKVLPRVCKSDSLCCGDWIIIKKHIPNFKLFPLMYEKDITIPMFATVLPHVAGTGTLF